uniref:Uncharacterized protein n=1 Tax=Suricata suricatta TaxID=37032 RepID=A0A673T5Z8_SURSU
QGERIPGKLRTVSAEPDTDELPHSRDPWPPENVIYKDHSLPSPNWSKDMSLVFDQLLRKGEDNSWKHLPLYKCKSIQRIRGFKSFFPVTKPVKEEQMSQAPLFPRSFEDTPGFEYAMFHNHVEERAFAYFKEVLICKEHVVSFMEGAIATVIRATVGMSAVRAEGIVMAANLNISFIFFKPIPLCSAVINSHLDKVQGRKLFPVTFKLDSEKSLTSKNFLCILHQSALGSPSARGSCYFQSCPSPSAPTG